MKFRYLINKIGGVTAALALVAASMDVNATCMYHLYQEPVPESARKLSKVK